MMEAIVNTGRENNITYHPIMDNYPKYGNISKTNLNELGRVKQSCVDFSERITK